MWLATCEDEQGMWFDDPIAADTEEECRKIALAKWPDIQEGIAMVLWKCSAKGEIDRPAPIRIYKLRRFSRRGLMAEGAEVRASSEADAIAKARALFPEPEYQHDKFEIEAVE